MTGMGPGTEMIRACALRKGAILISQTRHGTIEENNIVRVSL